jgi:hypothetical protein
MSWYVLILPKRSCIILVSKFYAKFLKFLKILYYFLIPLTAMGCNNEVFLDLVILRKGSIEMLLNCNLMLTNANIKNWDTLNL